MEKEEDPDDIDIVSLAKSIDMADISVKSNE